MEQATEETPIVIEDTSHFKEVRRGFNNDLYVGQFVPFTPEDFTWRLTDVYVSDGYSPPRSVTCNLVGDPTPDTQAHIEIFLQVSGDWHGTLLRRDSTLANDIKDKPLAYKHLRVEWHHKGCRTDEQKRTRKVAALQEIEQARQMSLHSASKAHKLEACSKFNMSIEGLLRRAKERYLEQWVSVATKGDRDAWVLTRKRALSETAAQYVDHLDEVRDYKTVTREEKDLAAQVAGLRDKLKKLRNEQHTRYQALALASFESSGWEDNNGMPLPNELRRLITMKLGASKRDQGFPFED